MTVECRSDSIWFGGDYNPDQWPPEILAEDLRLMKELRVNTVTLSVFAWAKLQPAEDTFDFAWLDQILDSLAENHIGAILATPTAAQPAWMSHRYPDVLPVDIAGHKRKHGGRANFCPNSSTYRRFAVGLAARMAQRYQQHPALCLWHVNNGYGTYCYCDTCAARFREWLQARYGTLEELNQRWYTNFWGHTYYDWDEIEPPSHLSEILPHGLGERDGTTSQGMALDYNRFMSNSLLECFRDEAAVIRQHTPGIPITTNLMGAFKPLDDFTWAKEMDIVAWDSYPTNITSVSYIAFLHDLMRGLRGGQPFLLMEQTPNQQNWQPYNGLKRPGVNRLWSYQALAHGADSVLFFQLRQSRGGCEKYHGAMIPHAGHTRTRVGRELAQLGEELHRLGDQLLGSRPKARVALMFDWQNWWAVENSSGPSIDLRYTELLARYYQAAYELNLPIDIIPLIADLSRYDAVDAPLLYMVPREASTRIEAFVAAGGTFLTTFFSGLVDENDLVILGGYPGAFRKLLGLWVEETDALYPDRQNEMVFGEEPEGIYACDLICDVVHAEGARVLASFSKDFYAGQPCVTENRFGKGKALYLASQPEMTLLKKLMTYLCQPYGILPLIQSPAGVEITRRLKGARTYTFILNHNEMEVALTLPEGEYLDLLREEKLSGTIQLAGRGVYILTSEPRTQ